MFTNSHSQEYSQTVALKVNKNDVKLGQTIKVPVTFTFANNLAEETITLSVKVPKKVPAMADVAAQVESYLKSIDKNTTEATINAKLEQIASENVIAGVTVSTVTLTDVQAESSTPATKKAKGTITNDDLMLSIVAFDNTAENGQAGTLSFTFYVVTKDGRAAVPGTVTNTVNVVIPAASTN